MNTKFINVLFVVLVLSSAHIALSTGLNARVLEKAWQDLHMKKENIKKEKDAHLAIRDITGLMAGCFGLGAVSSIIDSIAFSDGANELFPVLGAFASVLTFESVCHHDMIAEKEALLAGLNDHSAAARQLCTALNRIEPTFMRSYK